MMGAARGTCGRAGACSTRRRGETRRMVAVAGVGRGGKSGADAFEEVGSGSGARGRARARAISDEATGRANGRAMDGVRVATMSLEELIARAGSLEPKGDGKFTNESEYFHAYRELVRCKRLHDAVDLLRLMRRAGLKNLGARVSHRDFFGACRSLSQVSVGFEFVEVIESNDIRPYNMLVHACATAGDAKAAVVAMKVMWNAGFSPDLHAFTTLISACAKGGDLERAFQVYEDMKKAGLEPNQQTYAALIDVIKRDMSASIAGSKKRRLDVEHVRSSLDRCFDMYEEMKGNSVQPDATVMNSLLNACSRAATVPALLKIACSKAEEVHGDMTRREIKLDSYGYAALICCAVASANYISAFKLYDEMLEAGVERTAVVYTVMIRAYGILDKVDAAKSLWEDMVRSGVKPDQMAYATMMRIALLDHDEDFADDLMASMRMNRVRPGPELYAILTGVAARQGDAGKIEEILLTAQKRGIKPPIECYNSLIAAHARADRADLALKAVEKLETAGYAPDAITYEALIFAHAWARDYEEANKTFERLLETGMRPTFPSINCMVACQARSGQLDRVQHFIDLMKEYGYDEDEVTLRERLVGYARSGDIEQAWKVYKESRATGKVNSERALNTILGQTLVHIRSLTALSKRKNQSRREFGSFDEGGNYIAQEWAERAVAAFHEATVAGIVPRVETFSTMLACLRPPSTDEQNASEYSEVARAASHETSSHEDAARYYPSQALIMFEEAQSLGIVPPFSREEDFVYDVREFPPAAAEVMLLTWLRVVRRLTDSKGINTYIPTLTIRVRDDSEVLRMLKEEHVEKNDRSLARLCQTGERLLVLLRRLRINYGGGLQQGSLEVSGNAISRWLQGFVPAEHGASGSVFGESSLSGGVKTQAMRIRSNSFGDDDGVWTPAKMRRPAFNIYDVYGEEEKDDFGAKPYFPKNWVQSTSSYVSSYDEDDDDMRDLERIIEERR